MAKIDSTFAITATKLEIRKVYTPLYYGTNEFVERGYLYKVSATNFNPEYIVFHPKDFAIVNAALPLRILTHISVWHPTFKFMAFNFNPEISNG